MKRARITAIAVFSALSLMLGGCGGLHPVVSMPKGNEAYTVIPAGTPGELATPYVITPHDILGIEVFGEPDFSREQLGVDNTGNIQLPFIGKLTAAGQTADELGSVIADRLRTRYIVNPQVIVSIVRQAPRLVTIEGQITAPGVYEIDDNSTLLSVIARAKSPSKTARLNEIVIFRTLGNERLAARFNLNDIRSGRAPDPKLVGRDVIIVAESGPKAAYRDFLEALPLINFFYFLRN